MVNTNLAEDRSNAPEESKGADIIQFPKRKKVDVKVMGEGSHEAIADVMDVEQERVEQGLPDDSKAVIEKIKQRAETARLEALGGTEGSEDVRAWISTIMKDEEERTGEKITPPQVADEEMPEDIKRAA
jgi:hypothetical protein